MIDPNSHSQAPQANVEVIKNPNSSAYVNLECQDQDALKRLATFLDHGIPQDWQKIDEPELIGVKAGRRLSGLADVFDVKDIDSLHGVFEGESYMMIARPLSGTNQKFVGGLRRALMDDASSGDIKSLADHLGFRNDLEEEISVSPDLKQIIDSEEAQKFAVDYLEPGRKPFEGMRFLEPLLGIEYSDDGARYMTYRHIDGAKKINDPEVLFAHDTADFSPMLVDEISVLCQNNGLEPFGLYANNFLVAPDNFIYVYGIRATRLAAGTEDSKTNAA